jgi:hypothetical protein
MSFLDVVWGRTGEAGSVGGGRWGSWSYKRRSVVKVIWGCWGT